MIIANDLVAETAPLVSIELIRSLLLVLVVPSIQSSSLSRVAA
jgi:hypothetical protein